MENLEITKRLFDRLHSANIRYCHWKSNEHLVEGMIGETDLDLLVDHTDKNKFENVLKEHNIKWFETTRPYSHPSTEDYIGYDENTGRLIHLHTHYQLVLGTKIKEYQIPWEEKILSTRCENEETGLYTIEPNFELLLLFIRCTFKMQNWPKDSSDQFPPRAYSAEYDWLKKRANEDAIYNLTTDHFNPSAGDIAVGIFRRGMSKSLLKKFKKKISPGLKKYRSCSKVSEIVRRYDRKVHTMFRYFARKYNKPWAFRRIVPGGIHIAIIGADGAGKSTMTNEMADWLSWKLSVYLMYMGSNDDYSQLKRIMLWTRSKFIENIDPSQNSDSEVKRDSATLQKNKRPIYMIVLKKFWHILWALVISYEKRRKLKEVKNAKEKGAIVLTDRWPQNQYMGINDGPLLDEWIKCKFPPLRWIAIWERRPYKLSEINSPDILIKLNVSPETASFRDPDGNRESQAKKCNIVRSLEYDHSDIVNIDANKSKDLVLDEIKTLVWNRL